VENGETLNQSRSLRAIQTWLRSLKGNENPNTNIAQQHLAALQLDSDSVSKAFVEHKSLMKWNLLRNGIENLCLTSSAFITIKN